MTTPVWLNKEFVERVLRGVENDDSIFVSDIYSKPATNKGDNYMSDIIRVSVKFNRDNKARWDMEERSIIVKIAPTAEGVQQELVEQGGIFDVEMQMMTTTLKEMNLILKDTKLSVNCLYIQKKNPPLLVMEDLAPLGFRMADRQAGLDLQHCLLALKNLAKFHASSVAVCEKTPKYKDMYNEGILNSIFSSKLTKFYISRIKNLAKTIASWPELDQIYSDKLMNIADVVYDRVSECQKRNDEEFNVINHGDSWTNNMLFKYDDNGKVTDHIFVDFQMCVYGSPAIDLNYFLITSPSETVLLRHKDEIIIEYLKTLTATMRELKCKTEPPTITELRKAMDKREMIGFFIACIALPVFQVDKSQAPSHEEIFDQDSAFNATAYENKVCKAKMLKNYLNGLTWVYLNCNFNVHSKQLFSLKFLSDNNTTFYGEKLSDNNKNRPVHYFTLRVK